MRRYYSLVVASVRHLMYSVFSYLPPALLPEHPPFARYVKEDIFDPLELKSTTYSSSPANGTERMADGFLRFALNYSDPLAPGTPLALPYFLLNTREDEDCKRVGYWCSVWR
jgi:CubicO group peptidase (beta-lactamase class C family)